MTLRTFLKLLGRTVGAIALAAVLELLYIFGTHSDLWTVVVQNGLSEPLRLEATYEGGPKLICPPASRLTWPEREHLLDTPPFRAILPNGFVVEARKVQQKPPFFINDAVVTYYY